MGPVMARGVGTHLPSRAAILAVAMGFIGVGCGPSDPQPRAEPASTTSATTIASSTTTLTQPTNATGEVVCGSELPLFPTASLVSGPLVDTEGIAGAVDGADPAMADQVVRHWVGDPDFAIEIRWPSGPGPDVDSSIIVTQLVETGSPAPCDVVRVSGYGSEGSLTDYFDLFVDSLDGADAKPAFLDQQTERVTPAVSAEPGNCEDPIITVLDEQGTPEPARVNDLVERYAKDRTNGSGYESCMTIAGLRELDALLEVDGIPDVVRPSASFDFTAETLATYIDADPLRVIRESLRIVAIPVDGGHRLLLSGLSTGPDSNVGEDEAIAFIDEFLILLAERNYEAASVFLISDSAGPGANGAASDAVLAVMPTFEDEPTESLRRYCRAALCDVTYKVNDSIDFDATSRAIDVTFFGQSDTIELPMTVSAFEGKLVLMTPPPAD